MTAGRKKSKTVTRKKTAAKKATPKKKTVAKAASPRKTKKLKEVEPEIVEPQAADKPLYFDDRDDDREALQPEIVDIASEETDSAEELDDLEPIESLPESSGALTPADPVAKYMSEIRRYPLLTREEEMRLAKLYYDSGDKSAAETLVTSNLRFVVKIAAEYSKFGAKLIDLIQEGNVGLMHAVKEFNPYKGVKLITYAVWWIRGYIQEFLMRQYSMVRIGTTANQRKLFYQLQKQREELERMGLEQGVTLLSGRLGIPEEEIKVMHQRLSGRDLSLDQPLGAGDGGSLMDFQSDSGATGVDDVLGQQEELHILEENIEAIRSSLNEKELFLLDERLLSDEPKTLQEIGDHFGVTREAVRQMEVRVLKKLKDQMLMSMGNPE